MKIPETYEEFLKTPKNELVNIINSDELTYDQVMKLYHFNKKFKQEKDESILSESKIKYYNTLWEELYGDI